MEKQFVIVICGPTASGKTALSVELAKEFDAEIISADSMQIYKGMDIATAKPSIEERQGIPHHIMDFLDPAESFSVADYVKLAHEKIKDIASRGKIPMIVGGTGLYISSLINNIRFEESECDYAYREELRLLAQEKGNSYLLDMLREIDPATAATLHENNQARVIRALEVYRTTGKTMSQTQEESRTEPSPYEPCMIALDYDREQLYDRINKRVDIMLDMGLIEEAKNFFSKGDLPTAAQAIGYKELLPYLKGEKELSECVEHLKQETRKYAKRQLTWFRKDERIHWIKADDTVSLREIFEKAKKYIKICGNFR
ncbi:MAG: tRNA (adenosine(37)-N6)-dimethylallyltransferase MiaA [Ruminococcaceae bacterium]|nr:tRNA (adenosine(37)-N6)-dimethylallyltransferase MiaA [Oscillospiraceae bacterium]